MKFNLSWRGFCIEQPAGERATGNELTGRPMLVQKQKAFDTTTLFGLLWRLIEEPGSGGTREAGSGQAKAVE